MAGEIEKVIGARLKYFRMSRDVTQTKLARMVGLTFQQIQKYENGTNRISVSRLVDLAKVLEFNVDEFFDDIVDTPDGKARIAPDMVESLAQPESVELNRHFSEIDSMHMKRKIVDLVKTIHATQASSFDETPENEPAQPRRYAR